MSDITQRLSNTESSTVELTAQARYELLAAERRRLALDVLAGTTGTVELDTLAAEIATREDGIDASDEEAIEHVTLTLHHAHLPKMADVGVLDYDPATALIEPVDVLQFE